MTHTYKLTGMTCSSCEDKVKRSLLSIADVSAAEVSKDKQKATISMSRHISLDRLQEALGGSGSKYHIEVYSQNETTEQIQLWFQTYKPVLLIFLYVSVVSVIAGATNGSFNYEVAMRVFMSGFFLTFSFFKMLDLKAFAESYSMYDIIARKLKLWGYVYAFIELLLGIMYAINYQPLLTNLITLVVMTISTIGVLQSVKGGKKIQCACLGTVFNLPMSTVTIIEDALMIAMATMSLVMMQI